MTDPLDDPPAATLAADVVVLGGGAAGFMAAIEAAELGATVVVVESEPNVGGSTKLSGGYVALCETELQPASRAELLADLTESHHDDAQESLSQLYVDQAPAMYTRLQDFGLHFVGLTQFAHMTKPWAHELPTDGLGGGAQIMAKLSLAARERGVQIEIGTRARRLVRSGSGSVTGVETEVAGNAGVVEANKAVVLATGGFTRNPTLVKNFGRPGTESIYPITGAGSHGDGLTMAMALGAGTTYIGPGIAPTGPVEPTTGTGCLVNYSGGVLLGLDGRRFCDESGSYLDISWAALRRPDPLIVHLFDQPILDAYMSTMLGRVLSGWRLFQAPTLAGVIEAAAAECGVDAAQAVRSVQTYNAGVEAGVDSEFGRRNLIGTSGETVTIATPPFYAIPSLPGTTHFNGGLKIDEEMRVVDVFDQPIPRLYAAGEITGGFHGAGYLSATHLGGALIFGRLAGIKAAAG